MLMAIRSPNRRSVAAASSKPSPSEGKALPTLGACVSNCACAMPPLNSREPASATSPKRRHPKLGCCLPVFIKALFTLTKTFIRQEHM